MAAWQAVRGRIVARFQGEGLATAVASLSEGSQGLPAGATESPGSVDAESGSRAGSMWQHLEGTPLTGEPEEPSSHEPHLGRASR